MKKIICLLLALLMSVLLASCDILSYLPSLMEGSTVDTSENTTKPSEPEKNTTPAQTEATTPEQPVVTTPEVTLSRNKIMVLLR